MTHKVVSAVIVLIVALFVGAAVLFAWSVSVRAPAAAKTTRSQAPGIPHPTGGGDSDCTKCHHPDSLPAGHAHYTSDTCFSCHQTAGPGAIPHSVAGANAACATCHRVSAGTLPVTHRRFPDTSCGSCHATQAAVAVPHGTSMGQDRCVLCHGETTDPLAMPASHRSFAGVECAFCHAPDPRRASVQPPPAGESAKAAPAIAHPVDGWFKDCLSCHEIGGRVTMPAGHTGFGADTCRYACHVKAAGG